MRKWKCLRDITLFIASCFIVLKMAIIYLAPPSEKRGILHRRDLAKEYDKERALRQKLLPSYFEAKDEETYSTYAEILEKIFRNRVKTFYDKYNHKYKKFTTMKSFTRLQSRKNHMELVDCHPQALDLLILVNSSPENIKKRLAIRYSWAYQRHTKDNANYKVLFVVGATDKNHINIMLQEENQEFQDLIRLELFDTYRNLSSKMMLSFEWVNQNCKSLFLLKTDDDCFVNIKNLMEFLQRQDDVDRLYTGRLQMTMPVIRNKTNRFYIPYKLYREFLLPPYVSGGGYLISGHLIPQILQASIGEKVLPIEDANVGYLMRKISIKPSDNQNFLPFIYCNVSVWERPPCDYVKPYVIHDVENYGQLWMNFHVEVLTVLQGICKHSSKHRHKFDPPSYCPVNLDL